MSSVALIGIDLGQHSFHLHDQDGAGREVFSKKATRQEIIQPLSNLPACAAL